MVVNASTDHLVIILFNTIKQKKRSCKGQFQNFQKISVKTFYS